MHTFTVSDDGRVETGITIIRPALSPSKRVWLQIGTGADTSLIMLGVGEQHCDTVQVSSNTLRIDRCDLFRRRDGQLLFVRERNRTAENRILVRWQTHVATYEQINFETPVNKNAPSAQFICGAKNNADKTQYADCIAILYPGSSIEVRRTNGKVTRTQKLCRSLETDLLITTDDLPADTDGEYL